MSCYVGQYSLKCDLCLHTKVQHHLPVGELQPLPISEEYWDTVSIDFITELPKYSGYNTIMVVVDSVSKWSLPSRLLDLPTCTFDMSGNSMASH